MADPSTTGDAPQPLFSVDPAADPTASLLEIRTAHSNLIDQLNSAVGTITGDINNLSNSNASFSTSLGNLDNRTTNIETALTNISAQLNTLIATAPVPTATTAAVAPAAPVSTATLAPTSSVRPIKGAKLSQFSGKVQDVERFLQDLRDDIELQGNAFATDRQKVLYMASFLCGTQTAHDWVSGIRVSHPLLLDDFNPFSVAFERHFGASNKVEEALRKIRALKQTGSAANYAARFREVSAALPQDNFYLVNLFFEGLKQEVQKWIYGLPDGKGKDLDTLITRAIDGNNRLHEWARANKSSSSSSSAKPTTSSNTGTSSSTSQTTSGPAPMDLSATRVLKPLDATEKDRRKRLNLCAYCGGSHAVDTCQLLKEKNDRKANGSGKAKPQA